MTASRLGSLIQATWGSLGGLGGRWRWRCRGVESDAGVAMHVVAVIEECLGEDAGIGDGSEPAGETPGST